MKSLTYTEMETIHCCGEADPRDIITCILGALGYVTGMALVCAATAGAGLTIGGALLFIGEHDIAALAMGFGCGSWIAS